MQKICTKEISYVKFKKDPLKLATKNWDNIKKRSDNALAIDGIIVDCRT